MGTVPDSVMIINFIELSLLSPQHQTKTWCRGLFACGVTVVKTAYGNEVRAYDIDRTVCDIVRRKEEMDVQVFQTAMKGYMAGNQKNLHMLMAYAEALGVDRRIRDYTEVLL